MFRFATILCLLSISSFASAQNSTTSADIKYENQVIIETSRKLGDFHYRGSKTRENQAKALEFFEQAAELGDVESQAVVGYMYETGRGTERDIDKAYRWLLAAAKQGHAVSQFSLACNLQDRNTEASLREAREWYQKAAAQGLAEASNNLGNIYYYGQGVEKDDKHAARWYEQAAKVGNANAQCSLGKMYRVGEGVSKNDRIAAKWYRLAVEQGNSGAQNNLAVLYLHGKGVPQSNSKAIELLRLAANQGHSSAIHNLKALGADGC